MLVDPGPESSLDTLLDALGGDCRPRALLLTHIHLDHAGATGALVRRWPDLEVYVHERGAPHVIDPSKLLASAGRLYGEDRMERLWGEVAPGAGRAACTSLAGGETIRSREASASPTRPATPPTTSRYLHEDSGRAFVGDVAGVRIPPSDLTSRRRRRPTSTSRRGTPRWT